MNPTLPAVTAKITVKGIGRPTFTCAAARRQGMAGNLTTWYEVKRNA